ncbi:MAG: T9SS type A sorting domain-containing protein [Sphingobacteriales bacterium]|nr:MAG: T9SS type A sorting domain-containing protein [Sphingobacteriales bacterium]
MNRFRTLLIALTLFLSGSAVAQLPSAYAQRLQTVFDSTCARYKIRGASAAVMVPGVGIWRSAYGTSHAGVPIDTNMVFGYGSNTKTYIAVLLLKLQEQNLLDLDDSIGTWIHNVPNVKGTITVRQLLNHTSGLANYTENDRYGDSLSADYNRIWVPEAMYQFIDTPLFAPGAGWSYSNTNFLLAGIIIKSITGLSTEAALRQMLLTPQGLQKTYYFPQETPLGAFPHQWQWVGTISYDITDFGYVPDGFLSTASGAGALVGTADANVRFWQKLVSGALLNPASMAELKDAVRINTATGYGLGIFRIRNYNGHVAYSHGGTQPGFINENLADSVTNVAISVLTNQDSISNNLLSNTVVAALHKVTNNPPLSVTNWTPLQVAEVYPNPSTDKLMVQNSPDATAYTLTDWSGKTIASGVLNGALPEVSVAALPNGYYLLTLSAKDIPVAQARITVVH